MPLLCLLLLAALRQNLLLLVSELQAFLSPLFHALLALFVWQLAPQKSFAVWTQIQHCLSRKSLPKRSHTLMASRWYEQNYEGIFLDLLSFELLYSTAYLFAL